MMYIKVSLLVVCLFSNISIKNVLADVSDWYIIEGIAHVRDGDGVDVGVLSVDMFGIDAPPLETMPGQLAFSFLRDIIDGRNVTAICNDYLRSSNKPLCRIIISNRDVNIKLLDKGYAFVKYPSMSIYSAAQENARKYSPMP